MRQPDYTSKDGTVRLYCGDCLEILPTLAPGSVDAVVTDPPYGIGLGTTKGSGGSHGLVRQAYASCDDSYESFVSSIVPRLNASLDFALRGVVFTGPHIHEQRKPDAIGGVFCPAAAGRTAWGFKCLLPVLLYGSAPDLHLGANVPTVLRNTDTAEDCGHPCPKPDAWMVWAVRLASRDASTILDPFMGSGTTGVACVRTGRKFIGIEIERRYFDIAVKRIERAFEDQALFRQPEPAHEQTELYQ